MYDTDYLRYTRPHHSLPLLTPTGCTRHKAQSNRYKLVTPSSFFSPPSLLFFFPIFLFSFPIPSHPQHAPVHFTRIFFLPSLISSSSTTVVPPSTYLFPNLICTNSPNHHIRSTTRTHTPTLIQNAFFNHSLPRGFALYSRCYFSRLQLRFHQCRRYLQGSIRFRERLQHGQEPRGHIWVHQC